MYNNSVFWKKSRRFFRFFPFMVRTDGGLRVPLGFSSGRNFIFYCSLGPLFGPWGFSRPRFCDQIVKFSRWLSNFLVSFRHFSHLWTFHIILNHFWNQFSIPKRRSRPLSFAFLLNFGATIFGRKSEQERFFLNFFFKKGVFSSQNEQNWRKMKDETCIL